MEVLIFYACWQCTIKFGKVGCAVGRRVAADRQSTSMFIIGLYHYRKKTYLTVDGAWLLYRINSAFAAKKVLEIQQRYSIKVSILWGVIKCISKVPHNRLIHKYSYTNITKYSTDLDWAATWANLPHYLMVIFSILNFDCNVKIRFSCFISLDTLI